VRDRSIRPRAISGYVHTDRQHDYASLRPHGNFASDGKVLIAGGLSICFLQAQPCIGPNSSELYDPSTGAFTATGAMNTIQPIGGFLLPNGKVLFAEGYYSTGGLRA